MTTEDYRQIVPLKWYKFLIYFQLFAGAILNFANAFNYFTGNIYGDNAKTVYAVYDELYLLDMFYGCLLLIIGICSFKVRQDLAKFRVKGPTNYLFYLGISFGGSFAYKLRFLIILNFSETDEAFMQYVINLIITFIVGVVYIYLNKAYFDNRKFLFTETRSMMNKSQDYDTYTDTKAYENTTDTPTADYEEVTENENPSNKFLNSLTAQKERVKQQNTVANNKLTQNENPVKKIFCANCNKDLTNDIASVPGLMFCPYCDTPICLQSNQWTCSNCGKANPITVKFCKGCGTWVSAANEQVKEKEPSSNSEDGIIQTEYNTKQCVKCGFELKNDAKFCIICGERQPEIKQQENKI